MTLTTNASPATTAFPVLPRFDRPARPPARSSASRPLRVVAPRRGRPVLRHSDEGHRLSGSPLPQRHRELRAGRAAVALRQARSGSRRPDEVPPHDIRRQDHHPVLELPRDPERPGAPSPPSTGSCPPATGRSEASAELPGGWPFCRYVTTPPSTLTRNRSPWAYGPNDPRYTPSRTPSAGRCRGRSVDRVVDVGVAHRRCPRGSGRTSRKPGVAGSVYSTYPSPDAICLRRDRSRVPPARRRRLRQRVPARRHAHHRRPHHRLRTRRRRRRVVVRDRPRPRPASADGRVDAFVSFTVNVSVGSISVSPFTGTANRLASSRPR